MKKEKRERKKALLDWLREWPLEAEAAEMIPHSKKKKNKRVTFIGTETVTKEIRSLLGSSFKAKIQTKDSKIKRKERKEKAEKMRRINKEEEKFKYKAGSRIPSHQKFNRRMKAKVQRRVFKSRKEKEDKNEKKRKVTEKPKKKKKKNSKKNSKDKKKVKVNLVPPIGTFLLGIVSLLCLTLLLPLTQVCYSRGRLQKETPVKSNLLPNHPFNFSFF